MRVLIVGAGIAGPVLALLLKHKGFDPVVYEACEELPEGGAAVQLSPQSFKVLSIVGLAERAIALGQQLDQIEFRTHPAQRTLFAADLPSQIRQETGWPMCHVRRRAYVEMLVQELGERGIPLMFGKRVRGVEQWEDRVGEGEEEGEERRGGVRVTFEDGTTDEGELLVGCDGLNSTVRELVFDAKPAQYKGIIIVRSPSLPLPVQVPPNTARHSTQIGGLSPRPPTPLPPTLLQIFGDGAHFLSAPLSPTLMGWQCALPEPRPSSDSWRPVPLSTTAGRAMLSALPQARWTGAGRVVSEAVGAYRHAVCLRPPLEEWHSGRVVLVGDAANAATPHLGQGANQAAEDAYHLVRLLCSSQLPSFPSPLARPCPSPMLPLTPSQLSSALAAYTDLRVPASHLLVQHSLAEGQNRVVRGEEKCRVRNEGLVRGLREGRWREVARRMGGPFGGEGSEI